MTGGPGARMESWSREAPVDLAKVYFILHSKNGQQFRSWSMLADTDMLVCLLFTFEPEAQTSPVPRNISVLPRLFCC